MNFLFWASEIKNDKNEKERTRYSRELFFNPFIILTILNKTQTNYYTIYNPFTLGEPESIFRDLLGCSIFDPNYVM